MPFPKGYKSKGGPGSNGQIRRDWTLELVQQLNEIDAERDPPRRKIELCVRNLIKHAIEEGDERDEKGKLIKEGKGNLLALKEIGDRLEGKPSQRISVNSRTDVRVEYTDTAEVAKALLERGVDINVLPSPSTRLLQFVKPEREDDA